MFVVTKIYLFRLCIHTALTIFASTTCERLSFSNFWCGYRCRGSFAHVDSFEKGRKCCCIHKFIDMRLALTMIGNTRAPFHFFSSFNRMIMSINVPYGTVELLDQVTPERANVDLTVTLMMVAIKMARIGTKDAQDPIEASLQPIVQSQVSCSTVSSYRLMKYHAGCC